MIDQMGFVMINCIIMTLFRFFVFFFVFIEKFNIL